MGTDTSKTSREAYFNTIFIPGCGGSEIYKLNAIHPLEYC